MIKSKAHWIFIILYSWIIVFGIWINAFTLKKCIESQVNDLPFGAWVFVGTFGFFAVFCIFHIIFLFKIISIDEKRIVVKYPVINKDLKYEHKELLGWTEYVNKGRFGNYRSFHFETNDNQKFMFVSYEYRNYNDISYLISKNCKQSEINKQHNLKDKKFQIITLIAFIITVSTIFLTLEFGIK